MYNPKALIENLEIYITELKNLENLFPEEIEKFKSERENIEQYKAELKKLSENSSLSAEHIQNGLKLIAHPEGGSYREFIRTKEYTVIFYLLPQGAVSKWHSLRNIEETFKLVSGGILAIPRLSAEGFWQAEEQLNYNNDVILTASIGDKFGDWFGAYPKEKYSLVTCRCVPAFAFENFKMVKEKDIDSFCNKNSQYSGIIGKLFPVEKSLENSHANKKCTYFKQEKCESDDPKRFSVPNTSNKM
jgi:uncharacterized protein